MTVPNVSVLIPSYNRARYVGKAIHSVLDQTYSGFEIIVVDDGSTDDTADVVREFTGTPLRYLYQEHRGISGALNTAFRASRGRYLARLDSDDLWLPTLLAEEVSLLDAKPGVGLVYSRAQAMDALGRALGQVSGAPERYPGRTFQSLLYGDHISGITAIIRREHVEQVGLWDESLVANVDWDMWLRLSRVCGFYFIDKRLACFRMHSGRMTGGGSKHFGRIVLDRVKVVDRIYAGSDLPPDILEVKPLAYRNLYIDLGLRWLSVQNFGEGFRYFCRAVKVSPHPITTPLRILYLVLFRHFLSKRMWGMKLIMAIVDWRRRHGL